MEDKKSNKIDKKANSRTTSKLRQKDGKKKEKFSKKHPRITLAIRITILIVLMILIVGSGVVVGMLYGVWGQEFEISAEELVINGNSVILDTDGKVIAELSGDENRKIITLEEMPDNLLNAYKAIEDERFESHNGVDFKRTAAAIVNYIFKGGSSSFGGSTITQQLVKNITQEDDRSGFAGITRKVKEWAKAYQIERMLSKKQILELYLNIIFVGENNYGVETAALYYFNKDASELSLEECAFLAGINHAPNSYNPYMDFATKDKSKKYEKDDEKTQKINNRTKVVLDKMLELNQISKQNHDEACENVDKGLKFKKSKTTSKVYSSHTDATIAQVINDIAEEKKWTKEYATTYVYGGGLKIYSTQNSDVQDKMLKIMDKNSKSYSKVSKSTGAKSQAAMVVIDNKTGYVAGCVGELGEKTTSRGLNRATQSPRQTGSAIKPLIDVAPAVEEGLVTPATLYSDSKTEFKGEYTSWQSYTPKDQGSFRGIITLREAVTRSQNVPFVKVLAELSPAVGKDYLRKMGVTTLDEKRDIGLSMAIGGLYIGISPLEMAAGYATIENDGVYREPLFYTKIEDANGDTFFEKKQFTRDVFSEGTAYVVKDMLKSVVEDSGATAYYCKISGIDVAAKTGTTNNDFDRWLCGFTNYYTGATWYGYDEPEEVLGHATNPAGRIWSDVMKSLHKGKKNSKFKKPDSVVNVKICRSTGLKATSRCSSTYTEICVKGKEPEDCTEGNSKSVKICEDTELLANKYCPKTITQYYGTKIPKEALGLWKTSGISVTGKAPTKTCTKHNKDNTQEDTSSDKPTIKLKGKSSMTLYVGDNYSESGATATDKTDGTLTDKIIISGNVNTSRPGTYTVTYTVTNSKGKTTVATRTITVIEKETSEPTPAPTPDPTPTTPTPDNTPSTTPSTGNETTSTTSNPTT